MLRAVKISSAIKFIRIHSNFFLYKRIIDNYFSTNGVAINKIIFKNAAQFYKKADKPLKIN